MDEILFHDQLSNQNKGQSLYYNPQQIKCSKDDLIMISNNQGKYLFEDFAKGLGESPVFKVENVRVEKGCILLRLLVMEVLYPVPVFQYESSRANVLKAIREGLATVRETDTNFTFNLTDMYRASAVELREVSFVTPIRVQTPIRFSCACEVGCQHRVEVEGGRREHYQFFITRRPRQGKVDLNGRTGEWRYFSRCEGIERDTFDITIWDRMGSYAVQCVLIDCEQISNVQDVNITNCAVPVVACQSLPVIGSVFVTNLEDIETGNAINVASATPLPVELSGPINVDSLPVVTVYIGGISGSVLSVTLEPIVQITSEQPLEVSVVNTLTANIANALTIASLPEVTVANTLTIASLPEVTIANELTVGSLPEITVASIPEVTVANELTVGSIPEVTVASIPEVTVANELTIASIPEVTVASIPEVTVANELTIASIPEVTVASLPEVTIANELTVASLPEVTVASLPEVTIANELTVASLPEVTVASLPEVTIANELTVASLPEVTVASLPEVTIANELTIASLPTVVFDRPVEITFVNSELSPLYVVTVTAPVLVAANAFSQIQEGSIVIGPGSSTTLLYNVSESLDTTFFTHLVTPQVTVDLATVYSPLANSSYFQVVDSGTSLSDSNINYGLQVHQVNQFAGVQMTNTSPQGATVEVYVDSQGPVTSVTFS